MCSSPTCTEQPSRAVRRPSTIGGPLPKLATGALVGQSSAAHTYSGRTLPPAAASDSSGAPASAKETVAAWQLDREHAQAVARAALGAADDAGREGMLGGPALASAALRALELVGRDRLGHVDQELGWPAPRRSASRRRAARCARHPGRPQRLLERRRAAQCHLAPPRRRPAATSGRRCSRRWPTRAGPLQRAVEGEAVSHRPAACGSRRAPPAGRRPSGSRARADGRGDARTARPRRR